MSDLDRLTLAELRELHIRVMSGANALFDRCRWITGKQATVPAADQGQWEELEARWHVIHAAAAEQYDLARAIGAAILARTAAARHG